MRSNRNNKNGLEPRSPDVLNRACSELGVKSDTRDVCEQMVQEYAARRRYGGYLEPGVTAAALYLSSRLLFERTLGQKEVSDACGVAQVTLRSYVRKLRSRVNVNFIMAGYWAGVKERVFGPSTGYGRTTVQPARA